VNDIDRRPAACKKACRGLERPGLFVASALAACIKACQG
jgi:hypothetical protein